MDGEIGGAMGGQMGGQIGGQVGGQVVILLTPPQTPKHKQHTMGQKLQGLSLKTTSGILLCNYCYR